VVGAALCHHAARTSAHQAQHRCAVCEAETEREDVSQEQWWQTVGQYTAARTDSALSQDEDKHMKIGDMIESKYLKQSDVDGETLVTVVSLKKVNVARDDEDPEYRWTVKFEELPKPMVLNATNIKRMGKALGDDTDEWTGKQVVVYVDPDIVFGGNVVGGLRIRASARKVVPAKPRSVAEVNALADEARDTEVPF
jgi:hypothetical protein